MVLKIVSINDEKNGCSRLSYRERTTKRAWQPRDLGIEEMSTMPLEDIMLWYISWSTVNNLDSPATPGAASIGV